MAKLSNPLAFTRGPVTTITTIVYIVIIAFLIVIQSGPPTANSLPHKTHGINLTEAWNDLQLLSAEYHPYNSRRNDVTRNWLLHRIHEILENNNASSTAAYVFDDKSSNLTWSYGYAATSFSIYHESLNIIVYVRGEEDKDEEWWNTTKGQPAQRDGLLVSAHFDSVSTGFGATDDGVGVVTILQLLKFYTIPSNQPRHGIVLFLNNGEEDGLLGASVFSQHPMSKFVSSFLNLEGAGAGGRAALFRSTDEEVTRAYGRSPYPFGTVAASDAFKRGVVRSQTDYVIYNGNLNMRGLDVAFIEPRARYHTDQDDSKHTGKSAIWHMLSAALETTRALSHDSARIDDKTDEPHPAVWFDLFGRAWICMQTHTFFALAITLLVIGPILLLATLALLFRVDKLYLFNGSRKIHSLDHDETVAINGWRGYFRFPLIFVVSSATPIALAFGIFKVNPQIAHGSEWAVWAMMVSSFLFIAWFLSRALDYARPSALTRAYGLSWMCVIWWAFLVAGVVFEEQFHIASGYFSLFYFASTLLATWLSYLELFSLPKKSKYCAHKLGDVSPRPRSRSISRPQSRRSMHDEVEESQENVVDEEATEQSSLLRSRGRSAFKNYTRQSDRDSDSEGSKGSKTEENTAYHEQEWSKHMWTWLWILQFLILVPINLVVLGQLGLFFVAGVHQTGQDGSPVFNLYLGMAILTIFIFVPLVPLLHRFTWHVPMFLFLVLIATIIYNMLAFPFSSQSRLKLYFQQEIDLTTGANNVSLAGLDSYVQDAISYIPSAAGQHVECIDRPGATGSKKCIWSGTMPHVVISRVQNSTKPQYRSWINFNASLAYKDKDTRTVRFLLHGKNTRSCKIYSDTPFNDVHVEGQAPVDNRFPGIGKGGNTEIRLWHREWDRAWTVDVSWNVEEQGNATLTGRVACIWSDVNQRGTIPAFDEVHHFIPDWVAISKAADGLVEGYKRFEIK